MTSLHNLWLQKGSGFVRAAVLSAVRLFDVMNKRSYKRMVVPYSCSECSQSLAHRHAFTFHCECCVAVCLHCILRKLSVSDKTYRSPLVCPECNKLPSNIILKSSQQACKLSIKSAESYESELLASAFSWMKVKDFQNSKHKEKVMTPQTLFINLQI